MSTALLTDHYEFTMVDAALRNGSADRPCVFEVFARSLPHGRAYGVVAGLGRLIEAVEDFRFDADTLAYLDDHDVVSEQTLRYLDDFVFHGELHAYREGEIYVPGSPVLTVTAPFAQAALLETLILSVLNYDSAVASAASRMVTAAAGRSLLEFGSRRANEQAAVAAARAAYLAGFTGTSNLEAGRRHGVPTLGTSAHSFTLLHDDEEDAFAAQVRAMGKDTTLLIDTYDVGEGLERALRAGGSELGGVRIDSGDLAAEAVRAREVLDAAGAGDTRIVLSGSLDEFVLTELAHLPADGYGVGTSLVTGSGAPAAGFVYKLVARAHEPGGRLEPVAKAGGEKATVGARKAAARCRTSGVASSEHLRAWDRPPPPDGRDLQVAVLAAGELLHHPGLEEAREHHRFARSELPEHAHDLHAEGPAFGTVYDFPDQEDPS